MNRFHSLSIGAVMIFTLTAPAQQAATPSSTSDITEQGQSGVQNGVPTADEQLKFLTAKLDLTPDQHDRIKPILRELYDATLKVVQDESLSRDERLVKVRPQRYKARDEIRAILNDDQKKKLDEYLQGPHPEMHGNLTGATSSAQPQHN
jgi:hypothetical protein